MQYQIGDFSKISRLSVKTLRFYHETGLLIPSRVDKETGYRYYDEACLKKAALIHQLKELDFSLNEIRQILDDTPDAAQIDAMMRRKYAEISRKIKDYKTVLQKLSRYMKQTEEVNMENNSEITVKNVEDILIASIRYRGRYDKMGDVIKTLYKTCGRYANGTFFALYYDEGYREDAADIEICLPVSKQIDHKNIASRMLKGGKAVSLIYQGAYENIGQGYKILLDHFQKNQLIAIVPSREIYIKGPGMIFKGDPGHYLTEIQLLVQ